MSLNNQHFVPIRVLMYSFIVMSILCSLTLGQAVPKGRLTGKVIDSETGEGILGANVLLEGTATGAATDLDGKFVISANPGIYSVRVSVVGFKKNVISNVEVLSEQTVELSIVLDPAVIEGDEVVVEATAALSYESAVITRQKRAAAISDGISAEQIRRSPDATSGDALRRLSGVSLVDNKFIFIRGVTDRYNQTTLNGASVTSTSADKKSFSFDMLPSNLLENTIVTKSATPDLPGDFTGGLVQLNTLDFPERTVLRAGYGSSFNDLTTLKSFTRSHGGSQDWLAHDDGTRSMPSFENIGELGRTLPNSWGSRSEKAPVNQSFSLSFGDRLDLGPDQLGIIAALSYRNSFQRSEVDIDEERLGQFVRRLHGYGDQSSVLMGGILDASYKFGTSHKISIRNNYNRTADNKLTFSEGLQESDGRQRNFTTEWTERSMYTGQIAGEHGFQSLMGMNVSWQASVSTSTSIQPDRKEIQYSLAVEYPDSYPFIAEPGTRSWSTLHDNVKAAKVDITLPFGQVKAKTGLLYEAKNRNYDIRYFQTVSPSDPQYFSYLVLPVDSIYVPEHFSPGGFSLQEITKPSDTYAADQSIVAMYLMADVPFEVFSEKFRFVGGMRVENAVQNVHTTRAFSVSEPYTAVNRNIDLLPSVNLTYFLNEIANMRFAYSRTVNRPELRELANVYFYDFNSYEGVFGNPELERATIDNADARFELFPGVGELVAVSFFQKKIHKPIEEQFLYSSAPERTWINSDDGVNYGWEFEVRKQFDFLGKYFSNIAIAGNYSRIFSQVQYRELVRDPYTLRDEVVLGKRPMQGQSSYVINASFQFKEPTLGTSFNILYNRYGQRLDAIAEYGDFDIFERPRTIIDMSISQPLPWAGLEARFAIKNITDSRQVFIKGGRDYRTIHTGSTYSLQLSLGL